MDGDLSALRGTQRRSALRRAVSVPAEVTSRAWTCSATLTITNLSEHGLWLRAAQPVSIGDELSVSFRTPGSSDALCARARVVRVAASCGCEDCAEVAGVGACFIDLEQAQREALERSLRGLPPPLPRAQREAHARLEEPGAPIIPACSLMTTILAHTR